MVNKGDIMIKKILWTGGWDSTYRLLDLVINKNYEVQPYYVLDEGRVSTKMEIATMEKIKKMIGDISEEARKRILDTVFIERKNIHEDARISNYYNVLKKQSHLGNQYDWLARYTNSKGIKDLELCIHLDDTVEGFIKNDVELVVFDNDQYYKLVDIPSQKELIIFSFYHYPLFDMTKLDMENKAKDSGFDHIMEATWFCHSPYKGKPCGMCNPCKYTRDEGLSRRVPEPTIVMKINRKLRKKVKGLKRRLKLS